MTPIPPLAAFQGFSSVNSVVQTGNISRAITNSSDEAKEITLRIQQELEQWQDGALNMFAKLLPPEAHKHVEPAHSMASIKPASRLNSLFRCIHCTKVEEELRAHRSPRTLGKDVGAWRAMTVAQAFQHECGVAPKSKDNPDRQMEYRLAEPTYGLACDEEACLAVTSALAAANVDAATAKVEELEALGPAFRCCAEGCSLTMPFSRVVSDALPVLISGRSHLLQKYHVLRHTSKVAFIYLDKPRPKIAVRTDEIYDLNGKPSGVWVDNSRKDFKCRHCNAQPFNARSIRQHVHDR